jgi:hypothetical protein
VTSAEYATGLRRLLVVLAGNPPPEALEERVLAEFDVLSSVGRADGAVLLTGYHEPVIDVSDRPTPQYSVPVLGLPADYPGGWHDPRSLSRADIEAGQLGVENLLAHNVPEPPEHADPLGHPLAEGIAARRSGLRRGHVPDQSACAPRCRSISLVPASHSARATPAWSHSRAMHPIIAVPRSLPAARNPRPAAAHLSCMTDIPRVRQRRRGRRSAAVVGAAALSASGLLLAGCGPAPIRPVQPGPALLIRTGRRVSPPLYESIELLGRDRTLRRLEHAIGLAARTS